MLACGRSAARPISRRVRAAAAAGAYAPDRPGTAGARSRAADPQTASARWPAALARLRRRPRRAGHQRLPAAVTLVADAGPARRSAGSSPLPFHGLAFAPPASGGRARRACRHERADDWTPSRCSLCGPACLELPAGERQRRSLRELSVGSCRPVRGPREGGADARLESSAGRGGDSRRARSGLLLLVGAATPAYLDAYRTAEGHGRRSCSPARCRIFGEHRLMRRLGLRCPSRAGPGAVEVNGTLCSRQSRARRGRAAPRRTTCACGAAPAAGGAPARLDGRTVPARLLAARSHSNPGLWLVALPASATPIELRRAGSAEDAPPLS